MLTHEERNNYNLIYKIMGFNLASRTQRTIDVKTYFNDNICLMVSRY